MKSFIMRFGVMIMALGIMTSWYFIPDSFFVEYSDASEEQIVYKQDKKELKKEKEEEIKQEKKQEKVQQEQKKIRIIKNTSDNKIKQSVPFIVQAPHAQWDDPKFQDACEEASLVMANAWLVGKSHISKNDAEGEMKELFVKAEELFGQDTIDTSIVDTAKLFKEQYNFDVEVRENVIMKDLYDILAQGSIIIAPTNGKALDNPQFTNGGPDRHMLVITGYNKKNGEFVTNDPGTRLGRGYKYKDTTLYNAIRDYETGHKKDITGARKTVIIIKK